MLACVALLVWIWPRLVDEGMVVPVTLYIAVLGAMVCAALLARLPTPWTALGAVCFAVSDAMIGIDGFVLAQLRGVGSADLVGATPCHWCSSRRVSIFGRASVPSATPSYE